MSTRHLIRGLAGLCCLAGAGPLAAETVNVAAEAESVAITLPAVDAREPLLVEVDGYDVTAVVRIEAGVLTVAVRGLGLAPGEHRLRVLVSRANGDIDELVEHTLEVAGPVAAISARSWDVLLGSSWRVAEHPDEYYTGIDRADQRATLQWSAERDSGAWRLRGNAAAVYDSATSGFPDSHVWQSPGYLLQAERRFEDGGVALALGDDPIALGNLLFSSWSRRGLRLDAHALQERVQLQVFTLNSHAETRLDADFVPLGDTGSVQGGYAQAAPIPGHPEWLRVTSGYVSGDTMLGGVATSSIDPVTRYGGRAWNAALDSWSLGSALWLHAEYARSHFDSDGLDAGAPAQDDEARHFAAQLSSGGVVRLPGLDSWSLGVEQRRVGARFFSLGNLMLPGDLELDHAHLRFGIRGLQLAADRARMASDVDDDPTRARRRGHSQAISASYTPGFIDPAAGPWRLLGVPTLSAEWQDIDWRQDAADALLVGFDLDNRQRERSLGLDLSHEKFSWSLRHTRTRYDDRSSALLVDDFEIYTPGSDTRESTYSLQLTWVPNESLSLAPLLQSTTMRDVTQHTRSRNTLWGLQAQATLVPERWWLQASYNELRDRPAPFDPLTPAVAFNSGGGGASLVYRAHRAGERSPDVDLQLSGQYGRAFGEETWQLMLGFTVNWHKESL